VGKKSSEEFRGQHWFQTVTIHAAMIFLSDWPN